MSFDGNENNKPNEFKDAQKSKVKNFLRGESILMKFNGTNPKWYSVVCMDVMCLYASLTMSGCVPDKRVEGVQGDLITDLEKGITDLLSSLREKRGGIRWTQI